LALSYFTEHGPGICVDGTGQFYSNYAIVRTDKAYSNTTVDAEICSDWCYQHHEDPFVGFSSGGISGVFLFCQCYFSGGSVPTGLTYVPNHNGAPAQPGTGPIQGAVIPSDPNAVPGSFKCYSFNNFTPSPTNAPVTPSPTNAPVTPSPTKASQLALSYFTEQGPGICVDGTGQYYPNYAIVRTDKAYSNTTVDAKICSDWCYQHHEDPFVGFSSGGIFGGFLICECLFSGGSLPTGLTYVPNNNGADAKPGTGLIQGAVIQTDPNAVPGSFKCYSFNNFTPSPTNAPVTPSPTSHAPITTSPTSHAPVTTSPTSHAPVVTTDTPTTHAPVTISPTSHAPITVAPTSHAPVTPSPLSFYNKMGNGNALDSKGNLFSGVAVLATSQGQGDAGNCASYCNQHKASLTNISLILLTNL
jgi:hypothetical protein